LLNKYLSSANNLQYPNADCFHGGIYAKVNLFTNKKTYTYKYPMFTYPDNNDSLLDNCIDLHVASKRQILQYLIKFDYIKP